MRTRSDPDTEDPRLFQLRSGLQNHPSSVPPYTLNHVSEIIPGLAVLRKANIPEPRHLVLVHQSTPTNHPSLSPQVFNLTCPPQLITIPLRGHHQSARIIASHQALL